MEEDKNNLNTQMLTIESHWSPLELEIVDDDDNNLNTKMITMRDCRQ